MPKSDWRTDVSRPDLPLFLSKEQPGMQSELRAGLGRTSHVADACSCWGVGGQQPARPVRAALQRTGRPYVNGYTQVLTCLLCKRCSPLCAKVADGSVALVG